jgi:hypothetical protein
MYIGVTPAASDQTSFTLTNQIFHKAVRTLEMTLAACKYFFTFHLADYTLGDISNDARHHQIENCKTFLTYSKLLHLNLQRLATIRTRLLGRLGILPRQLHHSSIRKTVFLSLTTLNPNPYRTTCRASRSLPSSLLPSLVPPSRVASSQSKFRQTIRRPRRCHCTFFVVFAFRMMYMALFNFRYNHIPLSRHTWLLAPCRRRLLRIHLRHRVSQTRLAGHTGNILHLRSSGCVCIYQEVLNGSASTPSPKLQTKHPPGY